MVREKSFHNGNARLREALSDPEVAASIAKLDAEAAEMNRIYADTLAAVREVGELTQTEMAERLGVTQGAVSQLEKRDDMLVSTLRSYLAAAGAENPRLVVTIKGVEMEMSV